jgi:glycerol-3-phosphate acyltransferase PlsY
MEFYFYLILVFTASYLIGALPFGYLIAKLFYGVDIRKKGSGATGTTNVLRTTGIIPAILTFIFDTGKGALAFIGSIWVIRLQFSSVEIAAQNPFDINILLIIGMVAGFLAVLGHCYSIFLKFKGGKGLATAVSVAAIINWPVFIIGFVIWFVIVAFTRYVSLGSIIATISAPISTYFLLHNLQPNLAVVISIYFAVLGLFIIFMHRENIKRLLAGNENKLSFQRIK